MGGGGDGGTRVAGLLLEPGTDVARYVVVHEPLGGACRREPDDGLQRLVAHLDPADGVLGDVAVVGDDEGHRLARVVHLVAGQGVLRPAVGERRVRDQQGQRVGHRAGEVVVGPDQVDAVEVEHGRDVDVDDAGMGVG